MKQGKKNKITSTEIAIIGAGPIGLELAASLKRAKIDYIQFDAHQKGKERIPEYNPETMETNIPGLYLAGTVAAGRQNRYTLFIENSHQHVGKIVKAITGQWADQLGTVEVRQYSLPYDDIQTN